MRIGRRLLLALALLAAATHGRADNHEVLIYSKPLPADPGWAAEAARPRISGAVLVPEEPDWLPSHPLMPSFVLFVWGYDLSDGASPVRLEAPADAGVRYGTLGEGSWGEQMSVDIDALKRASELRPKTLRTEMERLARAWSRGWHAAKVPPGPYPPGKAPYAVLVRADIIAPGAPASQRFMLRQVGQEWRRPALPRRPEAHCPRLLLQSVHEDFGYGRWVAWDDIWGGVRLGRPPSMSNDLLLHAGETPATRLERQFYDMPQAIGEPTPSRSVADACLAVASDRTKNEEVMLAMVAEYYWSKRRLRDGILVTMQNLVPINKLKVMQCPGPGQPGFGVSALSRLPPNTPDTPIQDVACGEYHRARGVPEICQRLKQECRADEDFTDMIEQTDHVFRQWMAMEIEIRKRPAHLPPPSPGVSAEYILRMQQQVAERDKLVAAQKMLESVNPWVSQPDFRRAANDRFEECARRPTAECDLAQPVFACQAIKAQAAELEKRLLGHLDKFRRALNCIEGGPCDMNTDELRKTVHSAPPVLAFPEPATEGQRHHRIAFANAQFDWANGRRISRGYADNIDSALNDFYVGVALTGLTLGMGEVALALRGISAGVSTSASAARASLTGARLLEAGAVLVDLGSSAHELRNAVAECTAAFTDTTPLERVPFDTLRGPSCTSADYAGPRIMRESQSCITRAVLMEVATGLLPIMPDAVRRATDFTTLRRASRTLGRPLTPRETNALITLFSRPVRDLPADEVADIVHQLRIAGFKDADILDVLTALAPGLKKVGTKLVSGLRGTPGVHTTVFIDGVEHTAVISTIMGRTRLVLCSSCGSFQEVVDKLIADGGGSLKTREQLVQLRDQIRGLELRTHSDENFATEMAQLSRQIDELAAGNPFIKNAMRAREAAADPMRPVHQRPGGGRAYMQRTHGRPPGIADPSLDRIERLIESGRLSTDSYAEAATILDEMLYLERLRRESPNLVRDGDLKRVENMAKDLGATLNRFMGDRASKEIVDALLERYQLAKRAGSQTMAGSPLAAMTHADVDLPRTTAKLRDMVNARQYPHPQGSGSAFMRSPKLGEILQADHALPVARIRSMPGYLELDWTRRAQVLHNENNIIGLPEELNRIKGELDADDFDRALRGPDGKQPGLSDEYMDWLITKQRCMERLLRAQIDCLRPLSPTADFSRCNPPPDFKPAPGC